MTHLTLDTQQAYDLLTDGMNAATRLLLDYLRTEWIQEGYDRAVADGYGKQPEITVGSLWVDEDGYVATVNAVSNGYVRWGMQYGQVGSYTVAEFLAAFKPEGQTADTAPGAVAGAAPGAVAGAAPGAVAGAVEEPAVKVGQVWLGNGSGQTIKVVEIKESDAGTARIGYLYTHVQSTSPLYATLGVFERSFTLLND